MQDIIYLFMKAVTIKQLKDELSHKSALDLTAIKKYIRYSKKKETEAELLLYFCKKLKDFRPSIQRSTRLQSIFDTQVRMIKRVIEKLHEDLQYDFQLELDELLDNE